MSQDKNPSQSPSNENKRAVVAPPVDIFEDAERYLVLADLPGVASDDVEIRVEAGELTIRARRAEARADYQRRFSLPETVDADKIDAQLQKGVLHLTLPKTGRAGPRQINVRAA